MSVPQSPQLPLLCWLWMEK